MISLDHATHTYSDPDKPTVKYVSVTTLLGQYHEEFDEEYHSVWIINPKEFCLSVLQQLREMQNDLPEVIEIRDYLNQLNDNLTKETE